MLVFNNGNVLQIREKSIYNEASNLLHKVYGETSNFRNGQYEAIESIFTHKRTLVIQKTGWGKSLIYFIACEMLRKRGKSATIVVSPLLVLMDNQKEAAEKLGLKCAILNSKSNKEEIIYNWKNDYYDIIFITPETLFNELIQSNIDNLNIGLFVVDEVHCISDYGHDFRLKYMRLKEIIEKLPLSVPILGVTATATNRVIEDLKKQFGEDIYVLRGPLTRESLNIQVVQTKNMAEKYGWILSNINTIPKTGVIYCLTQHDCEDLELFLKTNGINCLSYHNGNSDEKNNDAIQKLKNNEIKVLIATIKLGMGYDKEDIGFIIHLQMAENVVSYYQQIGRAGRNLKNAYVFLLNDIQDKKIIDYFINTAFPKKSEQEKIYDIISNNNGTKEFDIVSKCNFKKKRISKALEFLENDNYIFYDKPYYYSTLKKFEYNEEHYNEIRTIRKNEVKKMIEFSNTNKCYNKFLANALDDFSANECGKCSNCIKKDILPIMIDEENVDKAVNFIYNRLHLITPRKLKEDRTKLEYVNCEGYCISYYGDYGYGQMVEYDKYNSIEYRSEIKERCKEVIKNEYMLKMDIKYITCVPSNHNKKMEDLTKTIASELGLTYIDVLEKSECPYQKEMENSYYQSLNAKNNYRVKSKIDNIEKIILMDDIVDSKWTLTWCGYYLMANGIEEVYPFTISDSSNRSVNNE